VGVGLQGAARCQRTDSYRTRNRNRSSTSYGNGSGVSESKVKGRVRVSARARVRARARARARAKARISARASARARARVRVVSARVTLACTAGGGERGSVAYRKPLDQNAFVFSWKEKFNEPEQDTKIKFKDYASEVCRS
jgi:hypothetical protein